MMLNLKKIEIEIQDKLATVWLNQPEIRNSLNPLIIEELIKTFKWLGEKNEIMVILIRGRGNSFCAGADINWMMESGLLSYRKNYLDSKKLASCFKFIYQSNKAVINLIHGHGFGGALGFIGAGDFTYAVKNTMFGLPELRLGLVSSVIMPYLLTRVKQTDLKYKIFTGNPFTAEEALNIGLVDGVYENLNEMEAKTNELIKTIFSASSKALTEGKKLLRSLNKNLINAENINKTIKTITSLKMSEEARNRMSKFTKK